MTKILTTDIKTASFIDPLSVSTNDVFSVHTLDCYSYILCNTELLKERTGYDDSSKFLKNLNDRYFVNHLDSADIDSYRNKKGELRITDLNNLLDDDRKGFGLKFEHKQMLRDANILKVPITKSYLDKKKYLSEDTLFFTKTAESNFINASFRASFILHSKDKLLQANTSVLEIIKAVKINKHLYNDYNTFARNIKISDKIFNVDTNEYEYVLTKTIKTIVDKKDSVRSFLVNNSLLYTSYVSAVLKSIDIVTSAIENLSDKSSEQRFLSYIFVNDIDSIAIPLIYKIILSGGCEALKIELLRYIIVNQNQNHNLRTFVDSVCNSGLLFRDELLSYVIEVLEVYQESIEITHNIFLDLKKENSIVFSDSARSPLLDSHLKLLNTTIELHNSKAKSINSKQLLEHLVSGNQITDFPFKKIMGIVFSDNTVMFNNTRLANLLYRLEKTEVNKIMLALLPKVLDLFNNTYGVDIGDYNRTTSVQYCNSEYFLNYQFRPLVLIKSINEHLSEKKNIFNNKLEIMIKMSHKLCTESEFKSLVFMIGISYYYTHIAYADDSCKNLKRFMNYFANCVHYIINTDEEELISLESQESKNAFKIELIDKQGNTQSYEMYDLLTNSY